MDTVDAVLGIWKGEAVEILPVSVDKVWPILADFAGYDKQFPQMFPSSETVKGEPNKIGAVRHLKIATPDGEKYCYETLQTLDDANHKTSYSMEDNNLGLSGYTASIAAESYENGQTRVAWSYENDPMADGTPEEAYRSKQMNFFSAIMKLAGQVAASK